VEMNLQTENQMLLHALSSEQCFIVMEDEKDKLIGTGPFKLCENNEYIFVLEAHDLYFRERTFLDRIELWNVTQSIDTYNVFVKEQHKELE
ncbi:SgrR family transcriptional regulator, partial [Bacillus pseudomycoides]|nr:SgrR family transcriptional regulator [Bacillus pseudomycoides]